MEKTEVNSQATDVSHTTELFVDDENIVISSPIATPILNKSLSKVKNNVDIMSIHTMSEVDDADDEEDEEDISSGRQSRIEMLAKKIMEEEAKIQNLNCQAKRDPINLNAELDTVSERSEIEDDSLVESIKHGNLSFFRFKRGLEFRFFVNFCRYKSQRPKKRGSFTA